MPVNIHPRIELYLLDKCVGGILEEVFTSNRD